MDEMAQELWDLSDMLAAASNPAADAAHAFDPFVRSSGPAFDPTCWPEVVSIHAVERHKATGADANAFALGAAQAMSVAIHPLSKLSMQPGGDWRVPPVLWGTLVGNSGANKSVVIAEVRWHALKREERERRRYARERDLLRQQYSDEKELAEALAEIAPIRALAPDATVEAMQDILSREAQLGWGLQVLTDELMRTLEAIDKYGPSRHHWLLAHDCIEGHNVDRIKRGSITIPVWAFGCFGGIQPALMANSKLKPETDGLMQRFIVCMMRQADLPDYGPTEGPERTTEARSMIASRIADSYDHPKAEFSLSIKAHYVRHAFLADNHSLACGLGDDPLAGFISKMRGVWGRVAMVFHKLEGEPAGALVSEATAIRASRFMTHFAYRHAARLYDLISAGGRSEDLAQAAGYLLDLQNKAGGGSITLTSGQLARGARAFRPGNPNRSATYDMLEAGGWLHDQSASPRSGMLKGRMWTMTPGLSERFAVERATYLANVALVQKRIAGA